jgi:heme A synthase
MQPVSPHRWRALPTALIVIVAIALGAATARADGAPAQPAAPSTSSAIR